MWSIARSACVLAIAMLLAVAGTALAGGDEEQPAPPTAGPPGPWDGPSGERAPFRPSGTRLCGLRGDRDAGAATVLGLYVERVSCRAAKRMVRTYQRCLASEGAGARRCYGQIERRCVRRVFLGRCRTVDRFYRRTVGGYRCVERRLYPIRGRYDANVTCASGGRRIAHSYTTFEGRSAAVATEGQLRAAWANPRFTSIRLKRSIVLRGCRIGEPLRESSRPMRLDGRGHKLRQTCFERRLLRQDGTGYLELRDVTLTGGGSDGPGAAVTSRGEITLIGADVHRNLAEEPGGGIMSQRRVTVIRSKITGNLANDDGGGVYARRGGIQVYDSVVSGNLVDGSGGALGSTGDILVVRSHVDGNTTDGDGGAIYTDEDGDVTVIDSTVDGSTADGPGGAIFTLEGDVTVIGSTLNGNRADDRGGAISGEGDVAVINSTIARNAAVAHVGGGIWARGDLFVASSTVSNNYAEGQGGGVFAAGTVGLANSTVIDNVAPSGANVGAGRRLTAFGTVIGPPRTAPIGGQAQPADSSCHVPVAKSFGYNLVTDGSCELNGPGDVAGVASSLAPLADNGGLGETRMPQPGSAVLDRIPVGMCGYQPFRWLAETERRLKRYISGSAPLRTKDQRGVSRPQGAGCDMGAVEAGP